MNLDGRGRLTLTAKKPPIAEGDDDAPDPAYFLTLDGVM